MDTSKDTSRRSESAAEIVQKAALAAPKRQQRTVQEKRRIVEETMAEGASVARVARAHGALAPDEAFTVMRNEVDLGWWDSVLVDELEKLVST